MTRDIYGEAIATMGSEPLEFGETQPPKKSTTTPKPYRLPSRTVDQLRQLVDGGWATTETAVVVEAINLLWSTRLAQAEKTLPPAPVAVEM